MAHDFHPSQLTSGDDYMEFNSDLGQRDGDEIDLDDIDDDVEDANQHQLNQDYSMADHDGNIEINDENMGDQINDDFAVDGYERKEIEDDLPAEDDEFDVSLVDDNFFGDAIDDGHNKTTQSAPSENVPDENYANSMTAPIFNTSGSQAGLDLTEQHGLNEAETHTSPLSNEQDLAQDTTGRPIPVHVPVQADSASEGSTKADDTGNVATDTHSPLHTEASLENKDDEGHNDDDIPWLPVWFSFQDFQCLLFRLPYRGLEPPPYLFEDRALMHSALKRVFDALRDVFQEEIPRWHELTFHFPQLDMKIGEDSSYASADGCSLTAFLHLYHRLRCNDGVPQTTSILRVNLTADPQFYARWCYLRHAVNDGKSLSQITWNSPSDKASEGSDEEYIWGEGDDVIGPNGEGHKFPWYGTGLNKKGELIGPNGEVLESPRYGKELHEELYAADEDDSQRGALTSHEGRGVAEGVTYRDFENDQGKDDPPQSAHAENSGSPSPPLGYQRSESHGDDDLLAYDTDEEDGAATPAANEDNPRAPEADNIEVVDLIDYSDDEEGGSSELAHNKSVASEKSVELVQFKESTTSGPNPGDAAAGLENEAGGLEYMTHRPAIKVQSVDSSSSSDTLEAEAIVESQTPTKQNTGGGLSVSNAHQDELIIFSDDEEHLAPPHDKRDMAVKAIQPSTASSEKKAGIEVSHKVTTGNIKPDNVDDYIDMELGSEVPLPNEKTSLDLGSSTSHKRSRDEIEDEDEEDEIDYRFDEEEEIPSKRVKSA